MDSAVGQERGQGETLTHLVVLSPCLGPPLTTCRPGSDITLGVSKTDDKVGVGPVAIIDSSSAFIPSGK